MGKDGTKALMLGGDANEIIFNTPYDGFPLKSFYADVRLSATDMMAAFMGQLVYEGLDDEGWHQLGSMPTMSMAQGGYDYVKVQKEEWQNKYKAIKIYGNNLGANKLILDNVEMIVERPFGVVRAMGEHSQTFDPTNDDYAHNYYDIVGNRHITSYTFTDLDPETEYYYRVRAHNYMEFSTGEKEHALGVATPAIDNATAVSSEGAYNANWRDVSKAQQYLVTNYRTYFIENAEEKYTLLNDQLSGATNDELTPINNDTEIFLDEYTDLKGWLGLYNTVGDGVIGVQAYTGGYIMTPPMMVKPNRNPYVMFIEAYGTPYDNLTIGMEKSGLVAHMQFDEQGQAFAAVTIQEPIEGDRALFCSYNGAAMHINSFELVQDVYPHDVVYVYDGEAMEPAGVQSHRFEGLEADGTYAYTVAAHFTSNDESVLSVPSSLMHVNLATGATTGLDNTLQVAEETGRYTVDGIKVGRDYKGIVIITYSNGLVRKTVVK